MVNPHVIIIVFWRVAWFIYLRFIYDIFPCKWSWFHHNTTKSSFQNHNPTIIPLYSQCIPNISLFPSRVAIPAGTIKKRQPGPKETSRAASAMGCLQQDRARQGFFLSIGISWEESSGNTILSESSIGRVIYNSMDYGILWLGLWNIMNHSWI